MSYSAKRHKSSTTRLPAALQEELGLEVKSHESKRSGGRVSGIGSRGKSITRGGFIGRKEARKAERQERKDSKRRGSNSRPSDRSYSIKELKRSNSDLNRVITSESLKGKAREVPIKAVKSKVEIKREPARIEQQKHVEESKVTPLQVLMKKQGQSSTTIDDQEIIKKRKRDRNPLSVVEQQEEDEIAWLEAHLSKRSSKKNSHANSRKKKEDEEEDEGIDGGEDGLDDLLEDLDKFYPGMYDKGDSEAKDSASEGNDEDEEMLTSSSGASLSDEDSEEDSKEESQDEAEDNESDASSAELMNSHANPIEEKALNDIKVAEFDRSSGKNEEGKYVPPALRRKIAETSESQDKVKLQRQAKGLLNRLGEGNLDAIVTEMMDTLYRQYSRATVTEMLATLVLHTVSSSSNLVETFVILQATLVTSLHRLIGIEFGAHFLQSLVEIWLSLYSKVRSRQVEEVEDISAEDANREVKNLTSLISNLYNIGLIASPLIYDLVRHLLHVGDTSNESEMTEIDVELLHKIVKTCGQQLRHDDATSLKAIVQLAFQSSISTSSQISSSRSRFMLEALENLKKKPSKSNAIPTLEQQSIIRMKKYLSGLSRKKIVRTQEPLRVGLQDLQDADKRGKWWLVGAAWAGYDSEAVKLGTTVKVDEISEQEEKKRGLIELARKHGMNTSIRQDIFVILISSQDYLEALERLQSLKFKKEIQKREIIRVLIHCIGSEVKFNPYYVIIASKLAIDDIGTKYTLQYCLWDFMRELGEKGVGGRSIIEREEDDNDQFSEDQNLTSSLAMTSHRIANVARAYGWWFAKGSLSLSATKVFNYTGLKVKATSFLQQVIIHLCLSIYTTSPALTLTLATKRKSNSDAYIGNNATSNKSDEAAKTLLEAVIVKGTLSNSIHSQGLLFFLTHHLKKQDCLEIASRLGMSQQARDHLFESRLVVKQILKVGASNGKSFNVLD